MLAADIAAISLFLQPLGREVHMFQQEHNTRCICAGEDTSIVYGKKSCLPCSSLLAATNYFVDSKKPCCLWRQIAVNSLCKTQDTHAGYVPQSKMLMLLEWVSRLSISVLSHPWKTCLEWYESYRSYRRGGVPNFSCICQTKTPLLW